MATRTRNTTLAVGIAAVLAASSAVAAPERPVIVLHLINHGDFANTDLVKARRHVDRVFEDIGVATAWREDAALPSDTQSILHLTVVLLTPNAQWPDEASDDVLGRAYTVAGRAYVFSQRVRELFAHTRLDVGQLLGHVIAHELGHLLLPALGHSRSGVMSAGVDSRESFIGLTFRSPEGRAIRALLEARMSRGK